MMTTTYTTLENITTTEIISELRRELAMRKNVFAKAIRKRTMSKDSANRRYLCVEKAIDLVCLKARFEQLKLPQTVREKLKKSITTEDVVKELQNELHMREQVYPNLMATGKLKPQMAQHRCACLQKAVEIVQSPVLNP